MYEKEERTKRTKEEEEEEEDNNDQYIRHDTSTFKSREGYSKA